MVRFILRGKWRGKQIISCVVHDIRELLNVPLLKWKLTKKLSILSGKHPFSFYYTRKWTIFENWDLTVLAPYNFQWAISNVYFSSENLRLSRNCYAAQCKIKNKLKQNKCLEKHGWLNNRPYNKPVLLLHSHSSKF